MPSAISVTLVSMTPSPWRHDGAVHRPDPDGGRWTCDEFRRTYVCNEIRTVGQYGYTSLCSEYNMTRTYTLKRRAEQQADTRRRIVEAAVDLHATVGPAATTVSMVAERAGVQRHTF